MGPVFVVPHAIRFGENLRFFQAPKGFPFQEFIPDPAMKRFDKGVLPGAPGGAPNEADPRGGRVAFDHGGHEFGTIVTAQMFWRAMPDPETFQLSDHVGGREPPGHDQGETLTRIFIHHAQEPQTLPATRVIFHKIDTPHVPRVRGAEPRERQEGLPAVAMAFPGDHLQF